MRFVPHHSIDDIQLEFPRWDSILPRRYIDATACNEYKFNSSVAAPLWTLSGLEACGWLNISLLILSWMEAVKIPFTFPFHSIDLSKILENTIFQHFFRIYSRYDKNKFFFLEMIKNKILTLRKIRAKMW